jgi:hypothetical protein
VRATPADVKAICESLPEVELGTSWGDRPTWKVPRGPKGRGFLIYREKRKDAIDPVSGEPFDDLLVIMVADEDAKAALVESRELPFFTIDHFANFNAVLVQESRLVELDRDVLVEVITEAWATRAPKRLVNDYFAER